MTDTLTSQAERAAAKGRETVDFAQAERAAMRKTMRHGPQRVKRLEAAIDAINLAMKPIRSLIGKTTWEPLPTAIEDDLRSVSRQLQYERRQLKKMQRVRD
jgi:hypothetical protein